MGQHIFPGRNIREEDSVQVDVNHLAPLLVGHFFRRGIDADTRIIMAEIQPAQLAYHLFHHFIHLLFIGAVGLNGNDFPACLIRQFFRCLFRFFKINIHNRKSSAPLHD